MAQRDDDRLAIHGGLPVRAGGPVQREANRPEILAAIEKVYRDGDWHCYHGRCTAQLRDALAVFHDVSHVELCCSGTAGLEIALKGVNVRPGDEVLVSGYDFKGVVSSVLAVGAVPVVVDLDDAALAPSSSQLAEAATDRTRAVVVSHLHGAVADMPAIVNWAKSKSVAVVEDACQSPGALIDGKRAGTWGDVGVLSFGGSKLLTAGRGGALPTSDPRIAQRMHLHCERGNHAFPLSELQAAVLLPQLETLDDDNRRRAEAVAWLTSRLDPDWGLEPTVDCSSGDIPLMGYYKLGLNLRGKRWDQISRSVAAEAFRAEGVAIDEGFKSVPELFATSRYRAADDLKRSIVTGTRLLVLHHPVLVAERDEWELAVRAIRKVAVAAAHGELVVASSS